ncbi:MAG: hypothetical protein HWN67_09435, partial [Candidatus Helarchaeota archaeon]|nr:hypothetical protein [Candidatus Helarchaeota archaeon]
MDIEKNTSILLGLYYLFIIILITMMTYSRVINVFSIIHWLTISIFIMFTGICFIYGADLKSKSIINIGFGSLLGSIIFLFLLNFWGRTYVLGETAKNLIPEITLYFSILERNSTIGFDTTLAGILARLSNYQRLNIFIT